MKRCRKCGEEISLKKEGAGFGQLVITEIGHSPDCNDYAQQYAQDERT